MLFFLGTLMTRRSEKNDIFFGLQRGVTLLGNIFKKAWKPNLKF